MSPSTSELAPRTLLPAVTTPVYESFWRFAAERQRVFFRRIQGAEPPWTVDPVIRRHRFTNAYRASDRVSQYLIRKVIYSGPVEVENLFFRIILFKTFNSIETWEFLEEHLGFIAWENYDRSVFNNLLLERKKQGLPIYSAAYIMPSGGAQFGNPFKHQNHLALIESMMHGELAAQIADTKHMRQVFDLLRSYPMIGDFLAYQYSIDLNYSPLISYSENEFVMPGPGARDGISKCFVEYGGITEADLIRFVCDQQESEFERFEIDFPSLWGRDLTLIDCQNLFCEISKYARVRHPEFTGVSNRTRIKRRFIPNSEPISYWYPPKWGINDGIEEVI